MKKLIVICGPTATGKTNLALSLAQKFAGEIISADSRQVYRQLDIGTGKDLPRGAKAKKSPQGNYWLVGKIRLWGYDLVGPKESFSVADYLRVARRMIKRIWQRGKLPILVGGTGFYLKGVVDGIGTLGISQNRKLRASLKDKKADELFEILAGLEATRAANLNWSDRHNPRRLLRAIEVALAKPPSKPLGAQNKLSADVLWIGLRAKKEILDRRIGKRVEKRLNQGIESEIGSLLDQGVTWSDQSMASLGYRQWQGFFAGQQTRARTIAHWLTAEQQYARRQLIWFKKDKRINWFDLQEFHFQKKVEKLVKNWHN